MMVEEMGVSNTDNASQAAQIGTRPIVADEVLEKEEEKEEEPTQEMPGAKTLDEIAEEVPQDIKKQIIDLEAE